MRKVTIGEATLYCGDCTEILPTLEGVDAVVTDPPYGINLDVSLYTNKKGKKHNRYRKIANDSSPPYAALKYIFGLNIPTIVFGSNNFPQLLPHKGRTIVWDKRVTESADGLRGSPIEIAWENRISGYDRIIRVQHGGVINADSHNGNNEKRHHPTQKPVKLISRCLEFPPYKSCVTILDPFMGSGTTGIACIKMGRRFIGIELEPDYFEIACKRIKAAYDQPDLFIATPPKSPPQQREGFL